MLKDVAYAKAPIDRPHYLSEPTGGIDPKNIGQYQLAGAAGAGPSGEGWGPEHSSNVLRPYNPSQTMAGGENVPTGVTPSEPGVAVSTAIKPNADGTETVTTYDTNGDVVKTWTQPGGTGHDPSGGTDPRGSSGKGGNGKKQWDPKTGTFV
jgi:hypothetical protein